MSGAGERNGVYDLIVAGGGPAGTSAAITAARLGARVLLLERGRFPRQKVCGEFVSPEALGLLEALLNQAGEAKTLLAGSPPISLARIFAAGRFAEFPLPAPGASIPRVELDAALWRAAHSAGAEGRFSVWIQKVERNGTFKVTTSSGAFSAKSVVDATGRWSTLNRVAQAGPGSARRVQWLGIKAHFDEAGPATSSDLYFFGGGYCGVQPVGRDRVNVCAMVRSDRARSLAEAFRLQPQLAERSRHWRRATEAVVTAPLVFRKPQALRGGVLLAGDAAGFLDPFAGDGISAALHSGAMAARSLSALWQGGSSLEEAALRYSQEYQRVLMPAFRTAERIRRLFRIPAALHTPTMRMLQVPSLARYLVRGTRASV